MRAARHGPAQAIWLLDQTESARPWGEANPILWVSFWFFIFFYNFRNSYKLLKYIKNTIRLRKIQKKFL
jgi:hypothetical protein